MFFPSGRARETLSALGSPVLMLEPAGSGGGERGPEGTVALPSLGELVLSNFRRNAAGSLMGVMLQRPETCPVPAEQIGAR